MADRDLFETRPTRRAEPARDRNEAGGPAYAFTARQALAQYAATGCLNGTFYASAAEQLDQALAFARAVADAGDPEFVAKVAVWARERGHMKDAPALLVAFLTVDHGAVAARAFDRVIDDGKMLRNFVQILRSGAVGRRSLGTRPKRLVRRWFAQRTERQLVRAAVGARPSLGDILRMVHPKPESPAQSALFAWLCGKPCAEADLPQEVRDYHGFLADPSRPLPDVPFGMLAGLELGREGWQALAHQATWQQTRIHLNTFLRHGALEDFHTAVTVAARLRDPDLIRNARAFPYQLMTTLQYVRDEAPVMIRDALVDAVEVATRNVPELPGRVLVGVDVSGSMHSPVTGRRRGATSVTRCVDVAALFAATMLRRNPGAEVLAFHDAVLPVSVDADAPVALTAQRLASLPAGGTNCSAPLAEWNRRRAEADLVVLISDMESWVDAHDGGRGTATLREWKRFKARNAHAKLVCLDLQPYRTTQAPTDFDVLNIGGFSDRVFDVVDAFARVGTSADHWVDAIQEVAL